MKKILNVGLWFCFATLIAQFCILGLAYFRGNIHRDTVVEIIALLNGIDIQGKRLQNALVGAKNVSVPTFDEILQSRARSKTELDNRESALDRRAEKLRTDEVKLFYREQNFDKRRLDFEARLDKLAKGVENEALQEVRRAIEDLPVEQAKVEILKMWEDDLKKEVVAIIQGMDADKRKKIMADFTQTAETDKRHEIFTELGKGEPLQSAIKQTKAEQQNQTP